MNSIENKGYSKSSIEGRAYIKDGLLWRVVEMDEKGKEKVVEEYVPK